jgi:hypothetical protein
MHSPINDLTGRLLKKFPGIPLENARAQAEELWATPAFRISSVWLLSGKRSTNRINPYAMEFFSGGIMRRLGIRAVDEQFVCSAEQARELSDDYIVKFDRQAQGQNLTWNPGAVPLGWCLASKLVPHAATLDYVTRKILKNCTDNKVEARDKYYVAFNPTPDEIERIEKSMNIDGPAYLRVCTAHFFLACRCTPHFGNILTTKHGELISIDHVHAYFESGESLQRLFDFIDRHSELFNILGGVASLTEGDIRAAVDEIPKHTVCGQTAELREYFCQRLRLWKQLYAFKSKNLTVNLPQF